MNPNIIEPVIQSFGGELQLHSYGLLTYRFVRSVDRDDCLRVLLDLYELQHTFGEEYLLGDGRCWPCIRVRVSQPHIDNPP